MFQTACRFPVLRGICSGVAIAVLLMPAAARAQADLPPPGPTPAKAPGADEPGIETLTQGPIHEAFANPADLDPTPGPVVAKQPPPDVMEDPPEFMPEGAIWIPGYWAWDDDRDEFLWVTGVARVQPPGMRWVPGYFAEAEGGWQRVSGFWVSAETPAVEYRPTAPPATLETGPSSPAPADDHFWIPGSWNYYDTGYRWQAGYWAPYQPNWIWVPARWVWTPGGFVSCPGFWDYRLAYRGQMFAPVYFQTPLYTQPGWTYRPWCVIPTNNLFIHMWIRPQWGCYYYGNYYDPRFANRGFVSWANIGVGRQRYCYDPFHSYVHVHYRRQGIDYLGRVQGWHNHYAKNVDLRPQRTWHEQQHFTARAGQPALETQLVARHVAEVARRDDTAVRLTRLDEQAQRHQRQQVDRLKEFHTERSRIEHTARHTAVRLPEQSDQPGAGREKTGRDADRGRDDRGRSDAKAGGSLVDRVEGKTGRENLEAADRPDRGAPKLTIPQDLAGGSRSVVRTQPGNDDPPGQNQNAPPPRPRPTSRVSSDNARPGGGGRLSTGTAKTVDRDDAPRSGQGKAGDQPRLPGNERVPGNDRNLAGDDRAPKTAPGTAGRTPSTDRESGSGRGPAANRGDGPNRSDAGKTRSLPQADRPGRAAETPRIELPQRRELPGLENGSQKSGGPDLIAPGPRPDRGRSPPTGSPAAEGGGPGRRPTPQVTPGIDLPGARNDQPRSNPRTDRSDAPRLNPQAGAPGGGNEAPRASPFLPRSSAPNVQPASPRSGAAESRGTIEAPRGAPRADTSPSRIESQRSTFRAETPAPAPRIEIRPQPQSQPRIETPRPNLNSSGAGGSSRSAPQINRSAGGSGGANASTSKSSGRNNNRGRDND